MAYLLNRENNRPAKGARVNICGLFWRFVAGVLFSLTLSILSYIAFVVIIGIVAWFVFVPMIFLFGKRLAFDKTISAEQSIFPLLLGSKLFERLCPMSYKVSRIENRVIRTVGPVTLLVFTTWLLWPIFWPAVVSFRPRGLLPSVSITAWCWLILGLAIGGAILYKLWQKFAETETGQITKAYLKAKKDKLCPLIEVV